MSSNGFTCARFPQKDADTVPALGHAIAVGCKFCMLGFQTVKRFRILPQLY